MFMRLVNIISIIPSSRHFSPWDNNHGISYLSHDRGITQYACAVNTFNFQKVLTSVLQLYDENPSNVFNYRFYSE